jgi:hypothetical protein
MSEARRVIVTRNDDKGKSTVLEDREVAFGGVGTFDLWETPATGALDKPYGFQGQMSFYPPAGSTQFRLFTIPPIDPSTKPDELKAMQDGFFGFVGPGSRLDTTNHPFMHVTPTVDYILLLSGEISLVLDEGDPIPLKQYDAVVQRGTNHSWMNTGKDVALLMAVMIREK